MKTELLAPAGSMDSFYQAIYNGANAIYLATKRFGARAYAKNFSLDELDKVLDIAHALGVKIYVTVNTIIKSNELIDAYNYIDELYSLGVDGLILTDLALIDYVINNCKGMEAHISTQSGVKDLNDVKFFESIKANRCVLARECSIDDIRVIKKNSKMPLEVFIHGALCVSYSGGCLLSSMISLRSGNRGRCSQNCRKEYTIYKNNTPITEKGFYLSMKDLNTSNKLNELLDSKVDSLKIEGRMKNAEYVSIITSQYRKIIDAYPNKTNIDLDNVFHRSYTKGFLFNEDKGKIVNPLKANNEGKYIGNIGKRKNDLTQIILKDTIHLGDRIRIDSTDETYFTIDKLFDDKNNSVNEAKGSCYVDVRSKVDNNSKVYVMIDSSIDISTSNEYKIPLTIYVDGNINSPLKITVYKNDNYYTYESNSLLQEAKNAPITKDSMFNQLSKLNDTPYYLESIQYNITDNVFMTLKDINELRRIMVNDLINSSRIRRNNIVRLNNDKISFEKTFNLSCFVSNDEQYKACTELGIKNVFYKNYSSYVGSTYPQCNNVLVGSYGGIYNYNGKNITSDYTFNVINEDSVYALHKFGVNMVTVSTEISNAELKELVENYKNKNNGYPNLSMIVYGYERLMTTKYCPLKNLNECGQCMNNSYMISDSKANFYITHKNCITNILNGSSLNLIDNLKEISNYVNDIRLDFTIEDYDTTKNTIEQFKNKINNLDEKTELFDNKVNTRGHFKRPIL